MTWTRCFSLYVAVMAKRRAKLVPPMIAHLHAVLKLMAWLQYDWKARREINTVAPLGRHKTFGSCFPVLQERISWMTLV